MKLTPIKLAPSLSTLRCSTSTLLAHAESSLSSQQSLQEKPVTLQPLQTFDYNPESETRYISEHFRACAILLVDLRRVLEKTSPESSYAKLYKRLLLFRVKLKLGKARKQIVTFCTANTAQSTADIALRVCASLHKTTDLMDLIQQTLDIERLYVYAQECMDSMQL